MAMERTLLAGADGWPRVERLWWGSQLLSGGRLFSGTKVIS